MSALATACYNHLVLPPHVPGVADQNAADIDQQLLHLTSQAIKTLRDHDPDSHEQHSDVLRSLDNTNRARIEGRIDRDGLIKIFHSLPRRGFLALHITEQNAGLILHVDCDEYKLDTFNQATRAVRLTLPRFIVFEALEASALSAAVLAAQQSLAWDFPGNATRVPRTLFDNDDFCASLAEFLTQASSESFNRFAARTGKGGTMIVEERQTADPALITSMLITLLAACGSPTDITTIRKHVRDDVPFAASTLRPWRRSPFWLVLRVAIQRHYYRVFGPSRGKAYYKSLTAIALERFADRFSHHLDTYKLHLTAAKLARRTAKLRFEKSRADSDAGMLYERLFEAISPQIKITLQRKQATTDACLSYRKSITRKIPRLPQVADQKCLTLQLSHSYRSLANILAEFYHESTGPINNFISHVDLDAAMPSTAPEFAAFHKYWFDFEQQTRAYLHQVVKALDGETAMTARSKCEEVARRLGQFLSTTSGMVDGYAEQQSVRLLLALRLWRVLDSFAVQAWPMLSEHATGLSSASFDTLKLSSSDVHDLSEVQVYIDERNATAEYPHIYCSIVSGCFAERFYIQSPTMSDLMDDIKTANDTNIAAKTAEWETISHEYNNLTEQIGQATCWMTCTAGDPDITVHDRKRCHKCFMIRKAKRMHIQTYEEALPTDVLSARAMIFELGCPSDLAAYRDASWQLISVGLNVGMHNTMTAPPRTMVTDFLSKYNATPSATRSFGLASSTKPVNASHYSTMRLSVELDEVIRPNGLRTRYYDQSTRLWSQGDYLVSSYTNLTTPKCSDDCTFAALRLDSQDNSNTIIAKQSHCPKTLGIHEYIALQGMIASSKRRWLYLLSALGSTTIKFGTEATHVVVRQLMTEVGPRVGNARDNWQILKDADFGRRLCAQLANRLDTIANNWREDLGMDILLTIILRLLDEPCPPVIVNLANTLLLRVRHDTMGWVRELRSSLHSGSLDVATTNRATSHLLWATLICKRTFRLADCISDGDMALLFECCMGQRQLVADPAKLPQPLREALFRDVNIDYLRATRLKQAVISGASLRIAVERVFGFATPNSEHDAPVSRHGLDPMWLSYTSKDCQFFRPLARVDFHMVHGYVLINRRPIGSLPKEHASAQVIKDLFQDTTIRTYAAQNPRMLYGLLVNDPEGHDVQVGAGADGSIFIRAWKNGRIYQYVPRSTFGPPREYDLPSNLIHGAYHWLDLQSGRMLIRQHPWKDQKNDFSLDFRSRSIERPGASLIDPLSPLQLEIADTFAHIVEPNEIMVHQTSRKRDQQQLTVEIPSLDLRFVVNDRGLLFLSQTRQEIDPDQDAGTLYGLKSKLVLRSVADPRARSILIPMNKVKTRGDIFPTSVISGSRTVVQFRINATLGRLDCPAEFAMIYFRILLHATTSSFIPDELTGRTGTEEALCLLHSAASQPWEPLHRYAQSWLESIAALSPRRDFYPNNLKVMQAYNLEDVPEYQQHDAFRPLVERILWLSKQLGIFACSGSNVPADTKLPQVGELTIRALHCRARFERPSRQQQSLLDMLRTAVVSATQVSEISLRPRYIPRDRPRKLCKATENVFKVASTLNDWQIRVELPNDLSSILQTWPLFKGHTGIYNGSALHDWLTLDLAQHFGRLIELCRNSTRLQRYQLMFRLCSASFSTDAVMPVIGILCGMAICSDMKNVAPPQWPTYLQYRHLQTPQRAKICAIIQSFTHPSIDLDHISEVANLSTDHRKKRSKLVADHESEALAQCEVLTSHLLTQWPVRVVELREELRLPLINVTDAVDAVNKEWQDLFQNFEYSLYVEKVQAVLHATRVSSHDDILSQAYARVPTREYPCDESGGLLTLRQCWTKPFTGHVDHPDLDAVQSGVESVKLSSSKASGPASRKIDWPQDAKKLLHIVNATIKSDSIVGREYGRYLKESLVQSIRPRKARNANVDADEWNSIQALLRLRTRTGELFNEIKFMTLECDDRLVWLDLGLLSPAVTPVTVLGELSSQVSRSSPAMVSHTRDLILEYAVTLTKSQRLRRIETARSSGRLDIVQQEIENDGHTNWQIAERPDWLLLEIEGDFMIRPEQVDVANATMNPQTGSNAVLQMNMGSGKTSVIMNMVATVLANGNRLVRLIVPRALLHQTAQVIAGRLGSLLGRQIRHVPFSRRTAVSCDVAKAYFSLHVELMRNGGVVLALPEHVMSFKLCGLQNLLDNRLAEATDLVNIQQWLDKTCRDVLDESDVTLSAKTQLVYPSGSQYAIDGTPFRWEVAESLVALVREHIWHLQDRFPHSVQVTQRPSGFPIISFLRNDIENALFACLIENICSQDSTVLPLSDATDEQRTAIAELISTPRPAQAIIDMVSDFKPEQTVFGKKLLLLRGLLAHRILFMCLRKRWNVSYGLHPERHPIAVPFHAKNVPSEQAEFGHPDVAILLTILAFYFSGLTRAQFDAVLVHLLNADNPSDAYATQIAQLEGMPESSRDWLALNTEDEKQMTTLYMLMRCNMPTIDYYLNMLVFPKHAKAFTTKIQVSGWDIPLSVSSKSGPMTTGFSGTNDNRDLLPLTIKQNDIPALLGTNAAVLRTLLEKRNQMCHLAAHNDGRRFEEIDLLQSLKSLNIRILIDAGAFILEMQNEDLVQAWMTIDRGAQAAVYFDDAHKATVLYRHGKKLPLVASPFFDDMADCVVYLDEAHTRGTDLRLPLNSAGVVTLGLGQTKDHTVQAAMRLRQLASTQSVRFFAPPEVYQSILDVCEKPSAAKIYSSDVVRWLIDNTVRHLQQTQPLYHAQGMDYCWRIQAALDYEKFCTDHSDRQAFIDKLSENDQITLERLYGVTRKASVRQIGASKTAESLIGYVDTLRTLKTDFQDDGDTVHASALEEVEQEREVEVEVTLEVETEQEVQQPMHCVALPAPRFLDRDVEGFVRTGSVHALSGFQQAFVSMRRTGVGHHTTFTDDALSLRLYTSNEFVKTVSAPPTKSLDDCLRPVSFVLWSTVSDTAVLVSPEEAELLIALCACQTIPKVHLCLYEAPVARSMLHFGGLAYYSIPALPEGWQAPIWLRVALGVFAGRVYFDFEEYTAIMIFLNQGHKLPKACADSSGLGSEERNFSVGISRRPLSFMQEWLAIRRKGQDFSNTTMGFVVRSKPLTANHPFFARVTSSRQSEPQSKVYVEEKEDDQVGQLED